MYINDLKPQEPARHPDGTPMKSCEILADLCKQGPIAIVVFLFMLWMCLGAPGLSR